MSQGMSEIEKVEVQIQQAKELIELRNRAHRLTQNSDFNYLFTEGYFVKEAARLIGMATDPAVSAEIRESSLEEAKATGYMRRYLGYIQTIGDRADTNLYELEEALVEMRAEEINN